MYLGWNDNSPCPKAGPQSSLQNMPNLSYLTGKDSDEDKLKITASGSLTNASVEYIVVQGTEVYPAKHRPCLVLNIVRVGPKLSHLEWKSLAVKPSLELL